MTEFVVGNVVNIVEKVEHACNSISWAVFKIQ